MEGVAAILAEGILVDHPFRGEFESIVTTDRPALPATGAVRGAVLRIVGIGAGPGQILMVLLAEVSGGVEVLTGDRVPAVHQAEAGEAGRAGGGGHGVSSVW
jgi:hypothetical protein